jgi:hypothetical protein
MYVQIADFCVHVYKLGRKNVLLLVLFKGIKGPLIELNGPKVTISDVGFTG